MSCNNLQRAGTRREPSIARFWDALVAEPDKTQALNDIASVPNPRRNSRSLS
jgi:hypothetical protein